jgi:hypothetical protein
MNRNSALTPCLLVGGIIILICKQMQCKISGNKLDGRSLCEVEWGYQYEFKLITKIPYR